MPVPTHAQERARIRNNKIFRIRGIWASSHYLLSNNGTDMLRLLLNQELRALGAMTIEEKEQSDQKLRELNHDD